VAVGAVPILPAAPIAAVLGGVGSQQPTNGAFTGSSSSSSSSSSRRRRRKQLTCAKLPMMPVRFIAKRKFFALLNTIVFYDQLGNELGIVQSRLIDWNNLYGYPGASFYVTAAPRAPDDGAGAINPKPSSNFYSIANSTRHRLVGSIIGSNATPSADTVQIRDCHSKPRFSVNTGVVTSHGVRDSTYYMSEGYYITTWSQRNTLIFEDLGVPAQRMVELSMETPCIPPFCSRMGPGAGFIWFGWSWKGRIVQRGYNQSVSAGLMSLQMTSGAATDMEFLALYSSFQFSNTRWAPLLVVTFFVLLLAFCCTCICGCCCTAATLLDEPEEEAGEETERLLEEEEPASTSVFACCVRRGVAIAPAPPDEGPLIDNAFS